MQLRYLFLLSLLAFCSLPAHTQNTIFLQEGKIRFEKSTNMFEMMQGDDNGSWDELMKKAMPHFKIDYFDLLFTKNKTLYQAGPANPDNDKIPDWFNLPENKAI